MVGKSCHNGGEEQALLLDYNVPCRIVQSGKLGGMARALGGLRAIRPAPNGLPNIDGGVGIVTRPAPG